MFYNLSNAALENIRRNDYDTWRKAIKIKKEYNYTQEQLADILGVSRQSISKWEANNGLPDVENLKALAQLLNVSVDYLLDDGEVIDEVVMREPYNLSDYGNGIKKKKKDRVIREKFPDAEIHTLLGKLKLTKSEKVIDNLLGFFTDAPFGTPELINSFKNMDKEFYLVEKDGKQFLVTITDEFVETRQLAKRITAEKFEIGNWQFLKCKYEVTLR